MAYEINSPQSYQQMIQKPFMYVRSIEFISSVDSNINYVKNTLNKYKLN